MRGKSFLISALLHLIFFLNIVFVFKTPQANSGPMMIFLGSILQSQDLSSTSLGRENPNIIPSKIQWQSPDEQKRFTSVKKPPLSVSDAQQKILFKKPQETDQQNVQNKENLDDSGLTDAVTPYQPLKFQKP